MKKILSVIAPERYQDAEYADSKSALESKGFEVITTSTSLKSHGKYGGIQNVDLLLKHVDTNDYDAILFVGGPGSYDYFDDPIAHQLAIDFYRAGKLVTSICAATSILANAGLLKGIKATCYESQIENIKEKGAVYTGASVEHDGHFITADGPDSATAFGEKIAEVLRG